MTEITNFGASPASLLAPVIAIALAVITRHVLLSLFAGILTGGLLLSSGNIIQTIHYLLGVFSEIFWTEQGINGNNINILLFLILLGTLTSWITLTGGTKAFANWARVRVKNGRNSQVLAVFLGTIIFIDDYFNTLVVGNICKPLTDEHNVSRAKLAYLTDSTAAPVCVMMPMSSWGAYIVALFGTVIAAHDMPGYTAFSAFSASIPLNFYAVFTLLMAFAAAAMDLNVGPMATHAQMAKRGQLFDASKGPPPGNLEIKSYANGQIKDLALPILVLAAATVFALIWTGADVLIKQNEPFSIIAALEHTNASLSLVLGSLAGLATSSVSLFRYRAPLMHILNTTLKGIKSMFGAICILVLAWALISVISALNTGTYLTTLVDSHIDSALLPALLFITASIMAFATGSSWGSFGIMLPLAGDMAAAIDMNLMLPMLSAVLAGAVFGDHCSPISDTTILSSTGASCHHIDHVVTQLPYSLSIAFVALSGYLVIGFTKSAVLAFGAAFLVFIVLLLIMKRLSYSHESSFNNEASNMADRKLV